jgi:predicted nucleotidyltransferase
LDISDKLDKELVERYTEVALAMAELNIPFLVVGASARDLFFEYAYGITAPRKTHDLTLPYRFQIGRYLDGFADSHHMDNVLQTFRRYLVCAGFIRGVMIVYVRF